MQQTVTWNYSDGLWKPYASALGVNGNSAPWPRLDSCTYTHTGDLAKAKRCSLISCTNFPHRGSLLVGVSRLASLPSPFPSPLPFPHLDHSTVTAGGLALPEAISSISTEDCLSCSEIPGWYRQLLPIIHRAVTWYCNTCIVCSENVQLLGFVVAMIIANRTNCSISMRPSTLLRAISTVFKEKPGSCFLVSKDAALDVLITKYNLLGAFISFLPYVMRQLLRGCKSRGQRMSWDYRFLKSSCCRSLKHILVVLGCLTELWTFVVMYVHCLPQNRWHVLPFPYGLPGIQSVLKTVWLSRGFVLLPWGGCFLAKRKTRVICRIFPGRLYLCMYAL